MWLRFDVLGHHIIIESKNSIFNKYKTKQYVIKKKMIMCYNLSKDDTWEEWGLGELVENLRRYVHRKKSLDRKRTQKENRKSYTPCLIPVHIYSILIVADYQRIRITEPLILGWSWQISRLDRLRTVTCSRKCHRKAIPSQD